MTIDSKPLVSLTEEAIQILYREMGVANTVRFLRQYHEGYVDYTRERRQLSEAETINDIVEQINQRRDVGLHDVETAYEKHLDKIRQEHPRAYEKWTDAEDNKLRQKHADGMNVRDVAADLGRQPSAIQSRLRKLGLRP